MAADSELQSATLAWTPMAGHLDALRDSFGQLLDRHRRAAADIDWSYADFLPLPPGQKTAPPPLSPMAYQAVETALLTEANLPWFTAILTEYFSDRSSPLGEFIRTWTSEEDQHGMLLESYLLITANGDPRARSRIRRQVVGQGWRYALFSPLEVMTYTAVQEAQTRAFYIHSARFCGAEDEQLGRALRRISRDETLHFTFYRDAVRAWLEHDPECLPQVARVVTGFKMPSWAIPDYAQREAALSEDIFGPPEFLVDVLDEVYSAWDIDRLPLVTREAHRARVALQAYRRAVSRLAAKQPRSRPAEAVR